MRRVRESSLLDLASYGWQWNRDPGALDRAAALANKAIALDDTNARAYILRGWVAALEGKRDQAIADSQRAVSFDPNLPLAWIARADINNDFGGKPEETLAYAEKATRLDPRHSVIDCFDKGAAYSHMGRYAAAVDELKLCEQGPFQNNPYTHIVGLCVLGVGSRTGGACRGGGGHARQSAVLSGTAAAEDPWNKLARSVLAARARRPAQGRPEVNIASPNRITDSPRLCVPTFTAIAALILRDHVKVFTGLDSSG
jgi:tetratricopeptide (TPR) repeat protein